MVLAESQVWQHVAKMIDCSVSVDGSRGLSSATSEVTLIAFRLRNDRGKLVPIHPEVLIVPDLQ